MAVGRRRDSGREQRPRERDQQRDTVHVRHRGPPGGRREADRPAADKVPASVGCTRYHSRCGLWRQCRRPGEGLCAAPERTDVDGRHTRHEKIHPLADSEKATYVHRRLEVRTRSLLGLAMVIFLLFLVVTPASAITYGEPDGEEHPYVGLVGFYDAGGNWLWRCSATLISPTILLTAAHCTSPDADGAPAHARSGSTPGSS